ncbi:hypothetical protein FIBSPDRAFT_524887 [Athelia psychrophila]|uniref:Uncharacterized protein n=1 Tax=Athelia psychrophila TaxID=1759441 RepID=A0A167TKE4_9AGAM|nr:hypothetical protein FIBSPDRAFT_524887 [Fibularhizoctonia sp. CBS 109695]
MTWHVPSTSDKSWLNIGSSARRSARDRYRRRNVPLLSIALDTIPSFLPPLPSHPGSLSSSVPTTPRPMCPSRSCGLISPPVHLPASKGCDRGWYLLRGARRRALTTSVNML